ncbi:hypothetical protein Pyn_28213 [Prunus yedoensis var. nudiflora]|uniref:Uncharacterized protein n=1 Tax=Prunus yedoensis var. nudiflora TaxID=2094558 RepID=A0A314Y3U5_PRUYE|nr:hypothetical protein Pyn_28213 [Prunus yedoensis var. nudiflora]
MTRHLLYPPWILILELMDNGYLETMVMVWICRNPGTLEGVLQQALVGQSARVGLSFSRMSIEDSAMLVWEPSPPVGRLVPGHMVVDDSSVWFSQTIPVLDCFPSALGRAVCARRTFHRRKRIEDSAVRAGEPSPLVERLIP